MVVPNFCYKLFLYFLLLSLLFSCSKKMNIIGTYWDGKSPETIILDKNNKFEYRYKFGIDYKYSIGNWNKIDDDKILLTSQYLSRTLPILIKQTQNNSLISRISVQISMPEIQKKDYKCLIFSNDSLLLSPSCDSIKDVEIQNTINSLYFKITPKSMIPLRHNDTLITEKTNLLCMKGSDIKVDILYNDSLFNFKIFKNKYIFINKHGLKFYSSANMRWYNFPKFHDRNK